VLEDLLLFIPLAVLTNTAFPLPFDPVLIWFAGGHTFAEACVFAGFGSGCAGLAALVDVTVIGALGRRWGHRKAAGTPMPPAGRSFYSAAFAVALLPIPYTVVRLALLRVRPRPLLYALIVSVARLPRYLVIIRLWQTLALPGWAGGAVVLSALGWIAWRRLRHDRFTNLFFVRPVVHISTPAPCCTRSGKLGFDPSMPLSTPTSFPGPGCRPAL
jgi:hypothetical protein